MSAVVRMVVIYLAVASAGCEMPEIGAPPPEGGADAGLDAGEPDANESTQLVVEFVAAPGIPYADDEGFAPQLDRVRIDLEDVRAIGDAGATSPAALVLEWRDDRAPVPYVANGVAPGMYAQVSAAAVAYDLRGSVLLDGVRVPFHLADKPPSLGLDMALTDCVVEAGQTKHAPVVFRADDVAEEIPWGALPRDDEGVIRLEGADASPLEAVRQLVEESFEPDGG